MAAMIKKMLVRQRWSDMNGYPDAKTDVISQILAHARVWRENQLRPKGLLRFAPKVAADQESSSGSVD